MCHIAGAPEVGDFRASSLPTLVEMVSGGEGVTLVPSLTAAALERTQTNLVFVPFAEPAPARTIGLAWRPTSARTEEFELLGEAIVASRGT